MDSDMSGMKMNISPRGCTAPMMYNPGFNSTSLPAETCTNTTSPLLLIPANTTNGYLALHLINSGSVWQLPVALDSHTMYVYAVDGSYVKTQEVNVLYISLGQRYSVMIKLDQKPGNYSLRFATYPMGDMQQVLEGKAIVSYVSASFPSIRFLTELGFIEKGYRSIHAQAQG